MRPRRRRMWPWTLAAAAAVVAVVAALIVAVLRPAVVPRPVAAVPPSAIEVRPATADDAPAWLQTTADPICEDHALVYGVLAGRWQSFAQIDAAIPASQWTTEQRDIAEATARAMLSAAAQYEQMLPRAENRVMQQLLAQAIVYLRANAENLPGYAGESDQDLAYTATRLDGAVRAICAAAPAVRPLASDVGAAVPPTTVAVAPRARVAFMETKDGICADYVAWAQRRDDELQAWELGGGDLKVDATEWTPEQRAVTADAARVLARNVDDVRAFAARAENPLVRDFLQTAVPYNELSAERMPTYQTSDGWTWDVANYLLNAVRFGCQT